KPRLYALVVGVSDYSAPGMTLAYAAKDARDFGKALQTQSGALYGNVEVRLLVDKDVTRASVIDGLRWLEQQVKRPEDVGALFIAGHGVTDEAQTYWFLPYDATPESARGAGVS